METLRQALMALKMSRKMLREIGTSLAVCCLSQLVFFAAVSFKGKSHGSRKRITRGILGTIGAFLVSACYRYYRRGGIPCLRDLGFAVPEDLLRACVTTVCMGLVFVAGDLIKLIKARRRLPLRENLRAFVKYVQMRRVEVLWAPLLEELVFHSFANMLPYGTAASVLSSVMFFLQHCHTWAEIREEIHTFFFSGLMALLYCQTGCILCPCLAHCICNTVGYSGTKPYKAALSCLSAGAMAWLLGADVPHTELIALSLLGVTLCVYYKV